MGDIFILIFKRITIFVYCYNIITNFMDCMADRQDVKLFVKE